MVRFIGFGTHPSQQKGCFELFPNFLSWTSFLVLLDDLSIVDPIPKSLLLQISISPAQLFLMLYRSVKSSAIYDDEFGGGGYRFV